MPPRIVGICLVRNEENFVLWALGNVLDFCDEIIVIDNCSTDRTYPLLQRFATDNPKVRLITDANASGSNAYVQDYIGENVWVFGVDGDEIYDREGLSRFRERVLADEFADYWQVLPHMAHATRVDLEAGSAIAYTRTSVGKFYNFAKLESWRPDRQRLHGPFTLCPGREPKVLRLHESAESWETGDFRCLHLCFFPRSGVDAETAVRNNITDKYFRHAWRRPLFSLLLQLPWLTRAQQHYLAKRALPIKNRQYMAGALSELTLKGFGRPASAAEAVISATSGKRRSKPDLRSDLELRYLGSE
jgi:glycosyltransferase involved in cell wall biosynthesis